MGAGWPFAGRQEELALIAAALGDQDVRGLVLAGPVGVGKTRLADEALRAADRQRCVSQRVAATEAARLIPFGALAPLLPVQLPAAGSRINLLRWAADALAATAGSRQLVLGVDDAHLLDDLSAALLHQLVRNAAVFALVVRSGEPAPDAVTVLWRNRLAERVDLQDRLLEPGCSPWRLRPTVAALRLPSRRVAKGPTGGAQVAAVCRRRPWRWPGRLVSRRNGCSG